MVKKEGSKKWESYREKQRETNTFEYKKEKYNWSKEEFKEYNQSRAITEQNLIKKHGIKKGKKKFDDYCKRQAYAGCSLDYFQDMYGKIDGEKKYKELNKKKALTRENFIRKYVKVEGEEKFLLCINNHHSFFSKMSQTLFKEIETPKCYYAEKNNEYGVWLHEGNCYAKLDFYDIDKNKCIEFNGDYWHANPKIYNAEDVINFPGKRNIKAKDIWDKEKKRLDELKYIRNMDILK